MIHNNLIIIRQSSTLKAISEGEVTSVLSDEDSRLTRHSVHVDMQPFSIDGEIWDESQRYIIDQAREIRKIITENNNAKIVYFGLAEVPHMVGLGAYLSDQHRIEVFDFNRDKGDWHWRENRKSLDVDIQGLRSEIVETNGEAVIRIEISSSINDSDVDEVVGKGRLADIRIKLAEGKIPSIATRVNSNIDVQVIREAFREALANLLQYRPEVDLIHLFISAPAPVCFVIGQELQLRNNVPIQTYRFRRIEGEPSYKKAILITPEDSQSVLEQLTEEEIKEAENIRKVVWPKVLKQVQGYADTRKSETQQKKGNKWFDYLSYNKELKVSKPFPQLPPIWDIVQQKDSVDPNPRAGNEYAHTNDKYQWQLSDRLLIAFSRACSNERELEQLIRLFLFHEYLHTYHSLTKYNVEQVGRFANCLEKMDYMADMYALIHQLDFELLYNRTDVKGEENRFLLNQLDLVLRSTWAFVPGEKVILWQVRSVRRLLNWYWRLTQVQESPNLQTSVKILSEAPTIELVGPRLKVGSGRVFMSMTELDKSVELAIGLVLENAKFLRRENSVNANLNKLLEAFINRGHSEIKTFFLMIFEEAKQRGGALPEL